MKRFISSIIVLLMMLFFMPMTKVFATNRNEANNFQEFYSWLETNKSIGGTLTLTNDIHIEEEYIFASSWPKKLKPITIQTNGFHIEIEEGGIFNIASIYANDQYHMTIQGEGEEKGLFHVRKGGSLSMEGVVLHAQDNGYALLQEEGSMVEYYGRYAGDELYNNNNYLEKGTLQFAKVPSLMEPADNMNNILQLKEGMVPHDSLLQRNRRIQASFNGYSADDIYMDIAWDISAIPSPKANKFYDVSGRFVSSLTLPDLGTVNTWSMMVDLHAQVIWTQHQFALVGADVLEYDDVYRVYLSYEYVDRPSSVRVMEKRKEGEWKEYSMMDMQYFNYHVFDFETSDLSAYYCFEVEYDGEYYSSNVVSLKDGVFVTHDDIEGSRGGISTTPPFIDSTPDDKLDEPTNENSNNKPADDTAKEDFPKGEKEVIQGVDKPATTPLIRHSNDVFIKNDNTVYDVIVSHEQAKPIKDTLKQPKLPAIKVKLTSPSKAQEQTVVYKSVMIIFVMIVVVILTTMGYRYLHKE